MSRADTTLDDWIDVTTEPDANDESDTHQAVSASCWKPEKPHCQCGESLTEWHSDAGARRMVRAYGDEDDGTVPACPNCVDWGHGESKADQKVESVPHAIKALEPTSSIERKSRRKLLLQDVTRDE